MQQSNLNNSARPCNAYMRRPLSLTHHTIPMVLVLSALTTASAVTSNCPVCQRTYYESAGLATRWRYASPGELKCIGTGSTWECLTSAQWTETIVRTLQQWGFGPGGWGWSDVPGTQETYTYCPCFTNDTECWRTSS